MCLRGQGDASKVGRSIVSICKAYSRAWACPHRLAGHHNGQSGRFLSAGWFSGYSLYISLRCSIKQDRTQRLEGPRYQAGDLAPSQVARCTELSVTQVCLILYLCIYYFLYLTHCCLPPPAALPNLLSKKPAYARPCRFCVSSLIHNCCVLVMCHCLFCGLLASFQHTTLYCLFY